MSKYQQELEHIRLDEQQKEKLHSLYQSYAKESRRIVMRKYIKPVAAMVACLAILGGTLMLEHQPEKKKKTVSDTITAEITKGFTITAYGQEFMESNEEHIANYNVGVPCGGGLSGGLESEFEPSYISYSYKTDFSCEGSNIQYVTYSINKGGFVISLPPDSTSLIDKTEIDDLNVMYSRMRDDIKLSVSSYTVAYENQKPSDCIIQMAGKKENISEELFHNVFCEKEFLDTTAEDVQKQQLGLQELLDGVIITCEVTYTDGTKESKSIKPIVTIEYQYERGEYEQTLEGYPEHLAEVGQCYVSFQLIEE